MLGIHRHEFVEPRKCRHAYADSPLGIGHRQTISQPYIVAWMSELLQVSRHDDVLEIGTGCGYQTAVLCRLAHHVYSLERIEELSRQAAINLQRDGAENFTLKVRDGTQGWPDHAPYTRIIVTAAPDSVPPALEEQLALGGRMVLPVGPRPWQIMTVVSKDQQGRLHTRGLGPVSFVPLLG